MKVIFFRFESKRRGRTGQLVKVSSGVFTLMSVCEFRDLGNFLSHDSSEEGLKP